MSSLLTADRRRASPRAASWNERGATFLVFLTLGVAVGTWAAALPALKLRLDLSDRDLSLALFALAIGSILSTLATGALAPRFGTGRSTGFAALVSVAACALPPLLPPHLAALSQFAGVTFLIGVTVGALDIAVNAHAGDIETRWGGPIMSSFHGAFSLGGLFGSSLSGLLASAGFGVGGQMWWPLGLCAIVDLVALAGLGRGAKSRPRGLGLALPRRGAYGLCAIVLFCFLIEGGVADWGAVYLATVVQSSIGAAAAGYAAFALAMALGRMTGDRMVAAMGPRKVVTIGGGLAVVGMGLAAVAAEPSAVWIGFALVGIGLSNVVPVVFSAAAKIGPTPAAGITMVATVGYAGFLSGPPIIGTIASVAGLRIGLGMMLLCALVIALAGPTVPKR